MMPAVADVISLPDRSTRSAAPIARSLGRTVTGSSRVVSSAMTSLASVSEGVRAATRRLTDEQSGATDDWGRDPVLVRNIMLLAQLRWDVSTGGDQHIPKRRGALVVVNSPRFSYSAVFAAFAISEAIDRPVRFVGRHDSMVRGGLDRRIGALIDHPDEVAGALRANEVVVMAAHTTNSLRSVGTVDHALIGAALATSTRVFPAATTSGPFSRRARVEIGPAARSPRRRRGPLTELELADRVRLDIHELLGQMGDLRTGTPLDWLPLSGLGAH